MMTISEALRTGEWTMSCGSVLFGFRGLALLQPDGTLLRWPIRCAYCDMAHATYVPLCGGCRAPLPEPHMGAVK